MKEFNVQVLFSGLINISVDAEDEEEAVRLAEEDFYSEASIYDSNIDESYVIEERDM